ncbi:MAG: hypothetical protein ABL999_09495 [Pyrinomonadaceae bacterium]
MKSTKIRILHVFALTLSVSLFYGEYLGGGLLFAAQDEPAAPDVFAQSAKLTVSDAADNDFFGNSVVISGDTAVVGTYNDDTPRGNGAGSAYYFTRSGGVWTQQQKLIASDGVQDDNFGTALAISGDTLVIGAERDDTAAGSAYVFTRSGNVWTQQQKLTAFDRSGFDLYGHSVAISGDTIVVGAFNSNIPGAEDAGSAYIYTRSGTVWTLQQKLTASDGATQDNFGWSVGITGDTVVVGAYQDDITTATDAGSAYIYTRSGTLWTQQQKLTAADGAELDAFGSSVGISGNTVVVGAFFDDTPRGESSGSAYVYTRSGTVWTEQQHLTASDGAAIDDFGYSVAISGNTIVIGAVGGNAVSGTNSGSAYVYTRSGTLWTQQQELEASDGEAEDFFGSSVAISGNTVLVGADFDDTPGGTNAGSAYVYTTPGLTVGGHVFTPSGLALRNAVVILTDGDNVRRTATTSSFGVYSFENVTVGDTYVISVASKRFRFTPQILQFSASSSNIDFVGLE